MQFAGHGGVANATYWETGDGAPVTYPTMDENQRFERPGRLTVSMRVDVTTNAPADDRTGASVRRLMKNPRLGLFPALCQHAKSGIACYGEIQPKKPRASNSPRKRALCPGPRFTLGKRTGPTSTLRKPITALAAAR